MGLSTSLPLGDHPLGLPERISMIILGALRGAGISDEPEDFLPIIGGEFFIASGIALPAIDFIFSASGVDSPASRLNTEEGIHEAS